MKIRRTVSWLAVGGLLTAFLCMVAYAGFRSGGGGARGEEREFEVPKGAGLGDVCGTLRAEGLLDSDRLFRLVARLSGADRELRAGWYRIAVGTPPGEILDLLRAGPNLVIRVTVPEGLWLPETAEILSERLEIDRDEILRLARDSAYVAELGVPGPTLEGYLFPETYIFFRGETARSVLERMTGRFRELFGEEEEGRAAELGLSPREVITLASIVEAEAVIAEERPRISAVFHNRLSRGWKLQADPTVQYARGNRKRLLTRHLAIDSPYNTYVIDRLPPGPICSPGAASIRAALHPTEGSQELYFVAAREGGRHIFSRTSGEHNRARRAVKAKAAGRSGSKSP